MKIKFKNWFKDESGAVTVDWVVLTATVIGMSAISFQLFVEASESVNEGTVTTMETVTF